MIEIDNGTKYIILWFYFISNNQLTNSLNQYIMCIIDSCVLR